MVGFFLYVCLGLVGCIVLDMKESSWQNSSPKELETIVVMK